ncbi:hypothetical protein [Thiolapillus sp.]|uniref:hypothetical protein n=1 Tax=Thiolapillus sp. TaxID=2017437 RepID=UPI003AF80F87
MTRTAGAPMGCQRPSRFWGLGCPKIYHEAEDTLVFCIYGSTTAGQGHGEKSVAGLYGSALPLWECPFARANGNTVA